MLVLKKPKTESSLRRVFIPATVAHQLKAWKREQERIMKKDVHGRHVLE